MRRLGCLLSLLLMGGGFILLAVFLIAPSVPSWEDNADLNTLYASLFCAESQTVDRDVHVSEDSDGTSYSAEIWCVNDDHMRTEEITTKAMLLGLGGFIGLLIIGLIIGIASAATNQAVTTQLKNVPNPTGSVIVDSGGR